MIDLYTWTTPNGRKVSIALEELDLEYTVHAVDITNDQQFDANFLAISPNNKIPAIVDQDDGQSLMESGAILLYLANKAGRLIATDKKRYWQTIEWLMWQMAGQGPMLGQAHHFLKFNKGTSAYAEQRYHNEAMRLYGVLEQRLAEREFIVEDYSIADIAVWPWVSRFEWHLIDLNDYPSVKRWYLSIASRAAVMKGYDVPKKTQPIPNPDVV